MTVAVLGNDIDPLGRGLTVTSRRGHAGRRRRRPTASRSRSRPSADFFGAAVVHLPRPRRRQHGRRASPRPRSTSPSSASRRRPARPTAREGNATADDQLGRARRRTGRRSTTTSCASTAARAGRSAPRPAYTWNGLTNGAPVSFSVAGPQQRRLGPVERRRRRPSPPTSSPAARRRRACSSPTARCSCRGRRRPTRAARSPTTTSRSAAGRRPSSASAPTTPFRWEGLQNGQEYTFQVRAVNAKGEGEFSSPSAPEHPLRQPDAPGAAGRRAGRQDDHRQLGRARQRRRPDHRVPGADPVDRRRRTRRRARRSAGPTCPTASPSSSRCGPATGPGGAPSRRRRRRSSPAACPTRPAAWRRRRGDGSGDGLVAGPERPGLRDQRLHGHGQRRPVDERRRRPDVGDVRRAQQRHDVHVHRRRPQRGRRRRPQRGVQRRRAGRACRAPRRSPAPPPTTEAGRRSRGAAANDNGSPITTYQLSVNGGGVGERRHRHVVHAHRASPTARRTRSSCGP